MINYWDERFRKEGKIWGDSPSQTALYAGDIFRKNKLVNILVPGSGYGRNAEFFYRLDFSVTGIEISEVALKIARQTQSAIKYYQGSVLEMPFEKELYDGIYCFNVLHLFRENERNQFIKKCFDQLRQNGLAFFTAFSEVESSFGKGCEVEPNTFESKPGRPVHYFTEADLIEQFKGFRVIETGLIEDPENHGEEGPHVHRLRYILIQKKSNFEFDGKKYQAASKHQKEWGHKIIAELKLNGNERILDLGCGDGVLTAWLANLVPAGSVLGIDASRGMIDVASNLTTGNLSFRVQDIDDIDFENEFDLIFSNATLHWVKDHRKLLRNCMRALKAGGAIRFNFAGDGNCSNFYRVVREVMADQDYAKYFTNFQWPWYMPRITEYQELVYAGTGFREVKIWEENADRYFANPEEMIQWIDQPSIVPFLKYVAAPDKPRFRNRVVAKMIEVTEQSDGTCFETFRRIHVRAVK